uniref:Uncharacterized protein n=1 Tax=Magallana gigas TaxID=29159 RepID=K1QTF7_MAGGI
MVVSDFDITLTQQAFADLKKSDDPGLPAPETPTSTRFAKLSDDEIKGIQELTQSKATKQSTKWGLKIQAMNAAGFEARHIMYFSGHRNEAIIVNCLLPKKKCECNFIYNNHRKCQNK